jgi:hypothetical protein
LFEQLTRVRFDIMRTTFALLIALSVPAGAFGQVSSSGQSIEDVRKNARMHVGPFYITPAVQLKELGVDTNVFNQAGEQKKDFMFNISPKADIAVPMARRALFTSTVATDLVYFAKYATERSVDPQVAFRGEVYLRRLTLFAEDAYLNSRQRLNYEIDLRARHKENNLLAGVSYRITPKFSIEAAGRRGLTEFDSDAFFQGTSLQQTLNRNTTGWNVTARHRLTPLTTLALKFEDFRDRFPYSPQRDTSSVRVMPGVEFKPKALVSGSAYVGFRRFTPEHADALPDYSGLVANLGLSYTLLGSTSFGVRYNRDVNYSFEQTQPYFVDNSVGASVRRALGRRFDALVSADRHRYAYRDLSLGLPVSSPAIPARVDTTWNYAGSIGYRIGREGRVGFGVSYWTRDSTTDRFRNYDGLRIRTTVTYGF